MFPAKFAYAAPSSLQEAVGLLEDPEAKVLAGGHSLLPLMKLRLAQPKLGGHRPHPGPVLHPHR